MGNISAHFNIQEFIPKEVFAQYGASSRWFVNPKIIEVAEFVRAYFDTPIIINDWMSAGSYNESGYRVPWSPTGAKQSQHKMGNAIDIKVKGISAAKVAQTILDHQAEFIQIGLTTIEDPADTPTWTHLDCRNTGLAELLIVNPK